VAAFDLRGVTLRSGGRTLLSDVWWTVRPGERWVVLGPNGAGKTTLVRLLATYLAPSSGTVDVLGQRIGRSEVAALRRRVAYLSPALAHEIPGRLTPRQVVDAAQAGAIVPWYLDPGLVDRTRTDAALRSAGLDGIADRPYDTFSSGEQLRVQLARALVGEPEALLLDEPTSSLDIGGREALVATLARLAAGPMVAIATVLHRVEDIPPGFTHALLVRAGRVVAAGPLVEVIADGPLSACFDQPLRVERVGDRLATRLG